MKMNVKKLSVCAILIALSTVLSELIPSIQLPLGGSVTLLSMVPVCLIGIMYGFKWALPATIAYGIIQLFFGLSNISYAIGIAGLVGAVTVIMFDYIIAYSVLSLSGIFNKIINNKILASILGVIVVCLLRYICHIITGATVYRELADFSAALWYSITYNGTYMIPEIITTPIGIALIMKTKSINSLM